jgi:bacteriocin-type transport-associated protein
MQPMRKSLYFLGILDDIDVEWIIRSGTKKTVPTGTVLIEEGKAIDAMFFVLDGEFEVSIHTVSKPVAILKAGEVLGELSFVDSRPPNATVKAIRESVVGVVPRTELHKRLEEDIGFQARFYHSLAIFLADRLRTTTSQLGYGGELQLDEDIEDIDELASHLLDVMSLAGNKFTEMQRRQWGS